ncbi:hypothetical protein CVT25_015175 [Psilocybe cyanescens]|uniref:Uncharacterized protein n=1 Tax=Psilocybe cyanescens TaxID=93625 RepID=A0A409XAP1_PSICY|nr:hypothetical protein CVT25_015175 [Psilocybe cyanescens]
MHGGSVGDSSAAGGTARLSGLDSHLVGTNAHALGLVRVCVLGPKEGVAGNEDDGADEEGANTTTVCPDPHLHGTVASAASVQAHVKRTIAVVHTPNTDAPALNSGANEDPSPTALSCPPAPPPLPPCLSPPCASLHPHDLSLFISSHLPCPCPYCTTSPRNKDIQQQMLLRPLQPPLPTSSAHAAMPPSPAAAAAPPSFPTSCPAPNAPAPAPLPWPAASAAAVPGVLKRAQRTALDKRCDSLCASVAAAASPCCCRLYLCL